MGAPLHVVFGGTFDPVHNGHLAVARAAADHFDAQVHLLPAADPPHRPAPAVSAAQRVAMLELALRDQPRLQLDTRELQRPGPSYSVDTLAQLRAELGPEAPLAWLVGEDAFAGLSQWHRWQELPGLAHWIIAQRPDAQGRVRTRPEDIEANWPPQLRALASGRWVETPRQLHEAPCGRLARLELPPRPESSSAVRQRIAHGLPWRDQVPAAVGGYIRQHGLYGAPTGGSDGHGATGI